VLYRPSPRSSWSFRTLSLPLLHSRTTLYPHEIHRTFIHTHRINLKKIHSWEKVAWVRESSSNPIYRDAPETFSGITLRHDLSGIRIGYHPIPSDCTLFYMSTRDIARRSDVDCEKCCCIAIAIEYKYCRSTIDLLQNAAQTYYNKQINLYKFLVWFSVCGKHYLIYVEGLYR